MELSVTMNQTSPMFGARKSRRLKHIAGKVKRNAERWVKNAPEREARAARQRYYDMKDKAPLATATAASAAGVITAKNNTSHQKPKDATTTTRNSKDTNSTARKGYSRYEVPFKDPVDKAVERYLEDRNMPVKRPNPTLRAYYNYFNKLYAKYYINGNNYFYYKLFDLCDGCADKELLDTFDLQNKIADRILSSAFLFGQGVNSHNVNYLHSDLICIRPENREDADRIMTEFNEMTDARVRILNILAENKEWQKFESVPWHRDISRISISIRNNEDADFAIELINNRINNNREKYDMDLQNFARMLDKNVDLDFIKYLASKDKLRYQFSSFYAKPFSDKQKAREAMKILDLYFEKYSNIDKGLLISNILWKLEYIFTNPHIYGKENPYDIMQNWMQNNYRLGW